MSASHKDEDKPVVINRAFIQAAATNAARHFFLPLTVVFDQVGPNRYVIRTRQPEDERH